MIINSFFFFLKQLSIVFEFYIYIYIGIMLYILLYIFKCINAYAWGYKLVIYKLKIHLVKIPNV